MGGERLDTSFSNPHIAGMPFHLHAIDWTRAKTQLPHPGTPQDRLYFIDALRGWAAFYVVCYHLALLPNPDLILPAWLAPIVMAGGTGVSLFFVVSAFTMCYTMRLRKDEPHLRRRFYLRRFFRIAPLFYVWMIASWIRDYHWYGVSHSLREIFLSLTFVYNFIPGQEQGFVWASWTLGVEMVFYLVFPFIYRWVQDYRKAAVFFLLTLALSASFSRIVSLLPIPAAERTLFLHYSFLNNLPIFACGMLAYFIYERFVRHQARDRTWGFVLLAAALAGYAALLSGKLNFLLDMLYWQALIFSCLLLGLAILPWRPLVNRTTLFYGAISYSFYLNHPTLIAALNPVYQRIYAWPLPPTCQYGVSLALTAGLLTLFSFATYRLIEQPGIRLGSRLVRRV